MKYCLSLLIAFVTTFGLSAKKGCEITIWLEHYDYDTLWFGTTVGKRVVTDFASQKQPDGSFLLKTEKPLPQGMYAVCYKKGANMAMQSFQVWLMDGERKFSIATAISTPYEKPIVNGSPENEQLFRYLRLFRTADAALDEAITQWRFQLDDTSWRQRVQQEEAFRMMQDDFLASAKPGPTARLVEQTLLVVPPADQPKAATWQQEAEARWAYQRAHFFDKMDLASPDFLRLPQWLDRADFFLLYLPPPHPDTTKALVDLVFKRLEAYPKGYEYYTKYIFNSLAKMSQHRLDEVYVHLARNYLQNGKFSWATAAEVKNALNAASTMEMLFEGQTAPPVTMFDRENNPVKLYDVQANMTALIFYMPDCGHCKIEIPIIARLYEKYKAKGLKVVAVCLKNQSDAEQCWQYLDAQNFPKDWYFLADPQRKANLSPMFNIKSYPRLFLLDSEKKIVYKRSGDSPEWQLDLLFGRFLK